MCALVKAKKLPLECTQEGAGACRLYCAPSVMCADCGVTSLGDWPPRSIRCVRHHRWCCLSKPNTSRMREPLHRVHACARVHACTAVYRLRPPKSPRVLLYWTTSSWGPERPA